MLKSSIIVIIFITFVVANIALLDLSSADNNTNQNTKAEFSVSELHTELSVASDNICNNHEKNVVFDVILLDNKMSREKKMKKREAPLDNKTTRDFADRPRGDQKSLLIIFDGTGSMYVWLLMLVELITINVFTLGTMTCSNLGPALKKLSTICHRASTIQYLITF
jgi:hypothetical protein